MKNWLKEYGITYSLMQAFLDCPQKYRLKMAGLYNPAQDISNMAFGTDFHNALAAFYTGATHTFTTPSEMDNAKLSILFECYKIRYEKDIFLYKHCQCEVEKTTLDKFAFPIHVKADLLVNTTEGLLLMEHKTKSQFLDEDIQKKQLLLDLQCHLYAIAFQTDVFIYDIIRKPMLKLSKNESLEEYKDRIKQTIYNNTTHYFQRFVYKNDNNRKIQDSYNIDGLLVTIYTAICLNNFYCNSSHCKICEYLDYCSGTNQNIFEKRKLFTEYTKLDIQKEGIEL